MSKTGRPTKDDDNARGRVLHVRLTTAEHVELLDRAATAGFATVSDFVRATTLQRRLVTPRPAQPSRDVFTPADRRALANLGNNLNQIARAQHSGRPHVMQAELRQTIARLDRLFDRYLPE